MAVLALVYTFWLLLLRAKINAINRKLDRLQPLVRTDEWKQMHNSDVYYNGCISACLLFIATQIFEHLFRFKFIFGFTVFYFFYNEYYMMCCEWIVI